ncbi:MAG TPA: DUF4381 domain-containing protein, partial [Candidatus Binatia bacterium]|nr:DUF4381 domain-containing protein [Candidatus Binatia bacterium]
VAVGLALRFGVAAWRRWEADAYRRAALAECRTLRMAVSRDPDVARALPVLVKRTALAAFPRESVAGLTGAAWLAFLDATGRTHAFADGPGRALVPLAYDPRATLDRPATEALLDVVQRWITEHRPC